METFADYILKEPNLINKMDILHRLQRMLREKKGINIFFTGIDFCHIFEMILYSLPACHLFLTPFFRL